jgi:hypothetical protein
VQKSLAHSLILTQCWLFAILWGIWILPETIFTRNACLILGAIIGLFVIYQNRRILWQRNALPIWLMVGLFVWVTIHMLWIGVDRAAQLDEYQTIWKRAFLAFFFALGLGISIGTSLEDPQRSKSYWRIIYFGFCLPIVIYFVKWLATNYLPRWGYSISKYLFLSPDHMADPLAISRAVYVVWFMPALAIALVNLIHLVRSNQALSLTSTIYFAIILLVALVFYLENDRYGSLISFLLIVIAVLRILWGAIQSRVSPLYSVIGAVIVVIVAILPIKNFQDNHQWRTLIADAKVGIQVDRYEHWKSHAKGYPNNDLGKPVSVSNYERIAWALVGSRLLADNPQGYGKLSLSFAALGKKAYPDSQLSWTHSGWLDFALGYGFIGLLLLAGAAITAWYQSKKITNPWGSIGAWGLGSISLVFLVKEVSTEIPVNGLIFLIVFLASINLNSLSRRSGTSSKKDPI